MVQWAVVTLELRGTALSAVTDQRLRRPIQLDRPGRDIPVGSLGIASIQMRDGTVGSSYSDTVSAIGGVSPYTYAVTSGSLPTGTSLNTSSGVVSGTTTAAGTYNFSITATDHLGNTAARSFTVVVSTPPSTEHSHVFIA